MRFLSNYSGLSHNNLDLKARLIRIVEDPCSSVAVAFNIYCGNMNTIGVLYCNGRLVSKTYVMLCEFTIIYI